jgi:putative methyltransferase
VIAAANLLKEEKKITSHSLALVLVHDLILSGGIQAGDGPVKRALLGHKTRLRGEWQRVKIKRGAKTDCELALADDERAGRRHSSGFSILPWMVTRIFSNQPGSLDMRGSTP